jgi:hypothetical protein
MSEPRSDFSDVRARVDALLKQALLEDVEFQVRARRVPTGGVRFEVLGPAGVSVLELTRASKDTAIGAVLRGEREDA